MGTCHTIPAILSTDNTLPREHCMLCWESISINVTNYVKCVQCKIRFHPSCVRNYKNKNISDPLPCPNCKHVGTFYIYKDGVYSCE